MTKRTLRSLEPGQVAHLERGIYVRRNKTGPPMYGISYTYNGTLIREMVGPTKTLAKEALRIRKTEIAQDKFKIPKKRRPPNFEDVCNRYLEYAKKNKRSWDRDEDTLKLAKVFFKRKRINDISSWDVERFKADRAKKVSKSTVNRYLAVLKRLFNLAIDWGLVDKNPVQKVALYRIEEKMMRVLSQDEEQRLIEAAAPHFKPLLIVAINTGMRKGELLDLQWEQVDLKSLSITIKQSKSGRIRHIPINKRVQEALEILPGPRTGSVFRYNGSGVSDINQAFRGALKRSGIPRLRFHDLRHTFATRLVLAGVDLATVMQLMGHTNISTTMKYAHPNPQQKRAAVSRIVSN